MELLLAPTTPRRRSPAGTAISAGLHLAVAAGGIFVAQTGVTGAPRRPERSIVFLTTAAPALPTFAGAPARRPAADAAARAAEPVREPAPAPVETVEEPAAPAVAVQPEPASREPVVPTPVADAVLAAPPRDAARPTVTVGGFDRIATRDTAAGVRRTVVSSGFNRPETGRATEAPRADAVRSAGFDLVPVASRPAAAAASQARIDTPVEILFKPTPAYTDEARALKIEGAVVLEVEFAATSEVHVLRILSGLGHGLDEIAARAAERIRFTPARAAGSAVDVRTTVHIVFRLT